MIRKDLIIAILATFCLTATLFLIIPTRSQTANQYDPWLDANADGKIDGKDIVVTAKAFGTAGDPTKNVNVTNWPSQLVDYKMRNPTQISLEQEFNWTIGQLVDVQGNLYVYRGQGFQNPTFSVENDKGQELRLAEWQNGWIELTYETSEIINGISTTMNVSLSPYILEIKSVPNNIFFTGTFHGN